MPLQSALISHAVDLAAYGNDVVRRVIKVLNAADAHLYAELTAQLSKIDPSEFKVKRLYELLASVRKINEQAYQALHKQLRLDLNELSVYEAEVASKVTDLATGLKPKMTVTVAQAIAAGDEQPFRGRLMSEWVDSMSQRRMRRLQDYLSMSFVEGRTVDEMVRAVRGTKAGRFMDGLLNVDRREAEAIVRTAIGHFSQAARELVFKANADIIKRVQWVSTLDTRTSHWCQIRDGLTYDAADHEPVGHKVPWLGGPGRIHWNCRSTSVPVMDDGVLGDLGKATVRASVDGPVSAKTTYTTWLKRQSAARQDEILGPTRGRLMRQGKYTLDRFHNNQGRYLTLAELRQRDEQTFEELGL